MQKIISDTSDVASSQCRLNRLMNLVMTFGPTHLNSSCLLLLWVTKALVMCFLSLILFGTCDDLNSSSSEDEKNVRMCIDTELSAHSGD